MSTPLLAVSLILGSGMQGAKVVHMLYRSTSQGLSHLRCKRVVDVSNVVKGTERQASALGGQIRGGSPELFELLAKLNILSIVDDVH